MQLWWKQQHAQIITCELCDVNLRAVVIAVAILNVLRQLWCLFLDLILHWLQIFFRCCGLPINVLSTPDETFTMMTPWEQTLPNRKQYQLIDHEFDATIKARATMHPLLHISALCLGQLISFSPIYLHVLVAHIWGALRVANSVFIAPLINDLRMLWHHT